MSRILQSQSIIGQIISRSFSRSGFCSTKYSLSVAPGHFCECCGINGTRHVSVVNKFKYGFSTPSILVQSSKFHTSLSTYSEESQDEEKKGEVEKSPRNEERREGVIDRLRRLSETPADDYELSPVAQEKARQMAEIRAESIRKGEHWKLDQRNMRPGGFPQQNQRYNNNRNGGFRDEEDFYGGGGGGRQPGYNRDRGFNRYDRNDESYGGGGRQQGGYNRNRSFDRYNRDDEEFDTDDLRDEPVDRSSWRGRSLSPKQSQYGQRQSREEQFDDNEPQDYEQEMERLRARLQKTKEEKARLQSSKKEAAPSEDIDSQERSSGASKSNNLHQNSTPRSQNLYHEHYDQSFRHVRPDKSFSDAREEPLHNQHQAEFQYPREDQLDLALAGYDPDCFGTLTVGSSSVIVKDIVGAAIQKELNEDAKALSNTNDEDEEDDTRYIPPYGKRWSSAKLITKVRELLKENKVKDAVDTFLGVLKQGGFDFDHEELRHHFHVLINECAKVGYVEMAFKLFNLMKKRGYKEKDRTISCLLNACANSPWDKENNLDRIENLLILNKEKGFDLNLISYTALIKAYGRLGETLLAFNVVDQMINESKIAPDTIVFNMLLQACITDVKNGFRHALVTWRKMHSLGLRPDTFSFNLLLRAIRDCGIEVKSIEGLKAEEQQQIRASAARSLPLLPPVITEEDSNRVLSFLCAENLSDEETQLVLDNLGEPSIISTKSMAKALSFPENRLAVLGGLRGMVSKMARSKVGPNLKTLTELMSVTHPSEFIDIMRLLKDYKIKPDVTFFTVAIHRCNYYNLHDLSKEMLKQMSLYNVSPNIVTWAALALGCDNWKEGKSYLEEMEEAKFTPNTEVMYSLLFAAVRKFDPLYVCHVMEETRRRSITLNEKYLILLEKFYALTQRGLISKEMGKPVESKRLEDALERNPDFPEHFAKFKMRYPVWLKTVDIKIDPENPWKHEFEKFKTHGRHTIPEKGVKEDEDFPFEPEKRSSSKIK